MSAEIPGAGECWKRKGSSPVRRSAPSLEQLAARYHKDRDGVEDGKREESSQTELRDDQSDTKPSLKRLGLTGRLGTVVDSGATSTRTVKHTKTPSLNEIRARLNQRGVDVTSSKWSKNGSSPTKETVLKESVMDHSLSDDNQSLKGSENVPNTVTEHAESTAEDKLMPETATAHDDMPQSKKEVPSTNAEANEKPKQTPDNHSPAQSQDGRTAALAGKSGEKKHPLQHKWYVMTINDRTLYYDGQSHQKPSNSDQYESKLKCIGYFVTLETFFDTFATLHRPSQLSRNTNYHLFKSGIKPMWEDPANAQGGRWVLTLREQANVPGGRATHEALLDRSWMWLVFGLIGEQLDDDDQVTGAVCSLRARGDRIALWLRNKQPVEAVNAIGEKFIKLLELESVANLQLEFSANDGSKADYMSLRNPPQPKQEPVSVGEAPVLNTWLDSDLTLHPTDHAWYYAQHASSKE
ncbi:hypothetical protein MYAM1_003927 [Malassezia yamatoensis]|uniref:Uncharacterized protein n=1 Tax=Malassezia yamatoensis TaxID=253288 RepID=A0AAJ5YX69_9BASI|nr:hypothetical protein MYAM1_003927 [Malassezia yamatoensis]